MQPGRCARPGPDTSETKERRPQPRHSIPAGDDDRPGAGRRQRHRDRPRRRRLAASAAAKGDLVGIGAATVLRIVFALLATQLLQVVGLVLAGGLLLLWVCWKMWQELHHTAAGTTPPRRRSRRHSKRAVSPHPRRTPKTLRQAVSGQRRSMSLDNVLGVAGGEQHHVQAMISGWPLSVVLVGVASAFIARLLNERRSECLRRPRDHLVRRGRYRYEGEIRRGLGGGHLRFHRSRVALPSPTRSADPAHGIGTLAWFELAPNSPAH